MANIFTSCQLLFTLFALSITLIAGQDSSIDDLENGVEIQEELMNKLRKKVPKYMPPSDLKYKQVAVKLDIYQILDVNEKDGLMTLKLFVYYYYNSLSAKWDPDEYNGTRMLAVPKDTFWTPDLTIRSAMKVNYDAYDKQTVWSSGFIVTRSTVVSAIMSCDFDVTYFPYDKQECEFEVSPMITYDDIYTVVVDDGQLDLIYYQDNDQWELITPVVIKTASGPYIHSKRYNYTFLRVTVKLARRPLYYLVIIVFPIVTLYLFSGLTFFVPAGSGEKTGFAVTLLLGEVVAFGTLSEIFPDSSTGFPLMVYFVSSVTLHMSFLCLAAIMVVAIHNWTDKSMSPFLLKIIQSPYLKYLFLNRYESSNGAPAEGNNSSPGSGMGQKLSKESESNMDNNANVDVEVDPVGGKGGLFPKSEGNSGEDGGEDTGVKWQILAAVVDRIFLIVHVIVLLINIMYFRTIIL